MEAALQLARQGKQVAIVELPGGSAGGPDRQLRRRRGAAGLSGRVRHPAAQGPSAEGGAPRHCGGHRRVGRERGAARRRRSAGAGAAGPQRTWWTRCSTPPRRCRWSATAGSRASCSMPCTRRSRRRWRSETAGRALSRRPGCRPAPAREMNGAATRERRGPDCLRRRKVRQAFSGSAASLRMRFMMWAECPSSRYSLMPIMQAMFSAQRTV